MSSTAVKLPTEFVNQAKQIAPINHRSAPKQIMYWAEIGKAVDDNPDLPPQFVKDCLQGLAEYRAGLATPFNIDDL